MAALGIWLTAAVPVSGNHEPARLGLTPVGTGGTYFEVRLDPGDRRQLQVEAANFSDEPVHARTYAADVYSLVNGGFGVELFGMQPAGTTTWVNYPDAEYELGPQDAVVVDFEVEIPTGTPAGEYVTALVIENTEPVRGSGNVAVDQVNRSAVAIAIEVPGLSAPALDIGGVRHTSLSGVSVLTFEIENPGNVHTKPAGEYAVRDDAGREVVSHTPVAMDSVYAGTTTTLEIGLPKPLAPGEYCAQLAVSDPETQAADSTDCLEFTVADKADGDLPLGADRLVNPVLDTLGASPVISAAVALAAAAALAGAVVLIGRRRRAAAAGGPQIAWPAAGLRVVSRFGRDRRWISDGSERTRHDAIVRERLVVPHREAMSLVEAANRLGVSVQTVRRQVKRGQLDAAYNSRGHISRVYLDEEGGSK